MIKQLIGIVIIIGGIIGSVLSATADMTGMNFTQSDQATPEFGWVQTSLVAVGIIILLFGIVFLAIIVMKGKKKEEEIPDDEVEVTPKEPAYQEASESTATTAEDLYGSTEVPVRQPPAQQQQQDMYAEQPAVTEQAQPASQDHTQEDYTDFSAGAETPAAASEEKEDDGVDDLLEDLDGLDGLEDLAEEMGGEAEAYECPDCGADIPAASTSCPECGAEFSEEIFECPVCGSEITEDASECPKCGEEFEDDKDDI